MPLIPKGLVLDFDGVLGDTVGTHTAARIRAFEKLGYYISPALHQEAHRHGSHPPEIIGWILISAGIVEQHVDVMKDPVVNRVVSLKNAIYREQAIVGLDAVRGALEMLDAAADYFTPAGLAIATTAHKIHEVQPFLRRHDRENAVSVIVGREATSDNAIKPHPFVYQEAAKLLKLDPKVLAALEDSPRGLRSAIDAGYGFVMGVATTHPAGELLAANLVFDSVPDVKSQIESWRLLNGVE